MDSSLAVTSLMKSIRDPAEAVLTRTSGTVAETHTRDSRAGSPGQRRAGAADSCRDFQISGEETAGKQTGLEWRKRRLESWWQSRKGLWGAPYCGWEDRGGEEVGS